MSTQDSRTPTFSQPSYFNRLPRGRYHCTLCDVTLYARSAIKHERSDSHTRRVRDDENVKQWWSLEPAPEERSDSHARRARDDENAKQWWSVEPAQEAATWEESTVSSPWLNWGVVEEDPLYRVEKWRTKVCDVPPMELAHELGGFGAELLSGDYRPTGNRALLHWANSVPMLDRQSDQRKQRMQDFIELPIDKKVDKVQSLVFTVRSMVPADAFV